MILGSEKGVFWKRSLFRKVHFLEILENLEILEILGNPQTGENRGESDHFLEILENSRDFRDSRDSSSEKTPFVMTPFSGPKILKNFDQKIFVLIFFPSHPQTKYGLQYEFMPNSLPELRQERLRLLRAGLGGFCRPVVRTYPLPDTKV